MAPRPDRPASLWPGDRGGHLWPKDREVIREDGVRVRYTVLGPQEAPWVVLCAGFLCPDNFWRDLGPLLAQRYRVVVLNYRGVGASTDPRDPGFRSHNVRSSDYTIDKLAGDVLATLQAEDATEVAVIGHSMGCQVALEVWHQAPDRIAALSLVTGPYASPLHTFYGRDLGTYLFPFVYLGLPLLPRAVQWAIVKAVRSPIAMPVARLVRALGPHTPKAGMDLFLQHFGNVDPMVTMKIAKGMHRFDATPFLAEVDVPVQVVVGTADTFSPPALGREMVAALPDAELVTVDGGTHAALIEFGPEISDAIADFLHRRLGHPAPVGEATRAERRDPEVST